MKVICTEKPLEEVWVGLSIVWGGVFGNHQGGVNGISQVDEYSNTASAPTGRGLRKGTMASASTLVCEKAATAVFSLKPEHLIPPHMFLVLSELLPQYKSSEQVKLSASKSMHHNSSRGMSGWDSSSPQFHSATIPTGFHSQKL